MSDSTNEAVLSSSDGQDAGNEPFRIVGIGASAGGLEALKAFFENVPEQCPHSFVIIQHLSPDYKTMMAELLSRNTALPIYEVTDGMKVEGGSIYLIPPNKVMTLEDGALFLQDRPGGQALTLPIDIFFQTLAAETGDESIGIILSGTGSDGTRGSRAIKEAGGMVMVQTPEQAKFDGMPLSVLRTGLADFITSVEDLPKELLRFIDFPGAAEIWEPGVAQDDKSFQRIISHIYHSCELDFSQYKRPTLARRIERRMGITKNEHLHHYLSYMYENPKETDILCREFLIGVTKFFRDTEMWQVMERRVIPDLVREHKMDQEPLRVWSVGCSTGEEVYTLAILLREEMRRQKKHFEVKIFATDLQSESLDIARRALYPESIVADVSMDRLRTYFVRKGEEYEVIESLRKMVIFSQHDILRDPPFRSIDILTCRNVLIYLKVEAQKRVIGMLHYALNLDGIMMLGPSETIHDFDAVFDVIDGRSRIYRNTQVARSLGLTPLGYPDTTRNARNYSLRPPRRKTTDNLLAAMVSETLVEEWGLAALHINDDFDILEATGNVRRFIALPEKGFSINLMKLLPSSVATSLGLSIRKAQKQQRSILCKNLRLREDEGVLMLNVLVQPMEQGSLGRRARHLLLFIPQEIQVGATTVVSDDLQNTDFQRIQELEDELNSTRENLQAAVEELETTNEELQATNEELLASNEELQSTNEELQSMNEELFTVNAEHEQKINDLAALNADMDNLLKSTEIGTIFLDADMRIRKMTPSIQEQFNLRETDVGRPIAHFTSNFIEEDNLDMLARAQHVMQTTTPFEMEVADEAGNWYLVKITPFRNSEGDVNGVVLSFITINDLKVAQEQLLENNKELKQFAYITSHDLQEPLRTISSFSTRFQNEYIDKFDERGLKYLHYMGQSADRMRDLLVDLLSFSRIGRYGKKTEVDMNRLLQSVREDLAAQILRTDAVIDIEHLPKVWGYELELRTLLQNLISNAVKFTRDGVTPHVKIRAEAIDDAWRFSVADNGIGIATEHQDRIFQIFQRLHTTNEYAGTGIGLANVKKIVELHEGEVWVESTLGQGSTFYFTLPLERSTS
ncbi:MAG: chemotaxis protein CheB [Rhodothermales bacterium]